MYNIIPTNDTNPHVGDSSCPCKPKVEFENGEMIVIHNSYDRREDKEKIIKEIKDSFKVS